MALYADFEGLHYPALLSDHGHQVKIVMAPAHGTLVYLDGVLVKGLTNVEMRAHVGELSKIRLEFYPSEVEIVGNAGEVERVAASPADADSVRTDGLLRLALDGLKKRNEAELNESEGQ